MIRGNGYDGEQLGGFIKRIDEADDDLLSLRSKHMTACKGPRGKIRNVMAEAKAAGLNLVAFRSILTEHRNKRKVEKKDAELELDDLADLNAMRAALGGLADTPLGNAALERRKQKGEAALDSLR